ncbi:MAG: tetratricopeptide repeat protein, partial [Candidatus Zixiibacteriota bacterium]
ITDDWRLIYDEKDFLEEWGNLKVVLTEPFPAETYEPLPFYRPMITAVNFANHHLLGDATFGYHIVNLGFHALNSILVYLLILLLFKKELLAFLSALFFSAHPIHTNSVVWISGRTDLVACFFVLVTLILFFKRKDHTGTWRFVLSAGALVTYLLALFSKEMALALPLFLLVWDYIYDKDSIRKKVIPYLPYLAVTILYLILRIAAIGNLGVGESYTSASLFQRFLTAFAIYFYYFKKFIFPLYLNFSPRVLTITSIFSLKFWGALIFFSVVFGLGLSLRRITKEVSFGIFWILVMLIPVLNLIPLHASVREWWAYIPSIGFCLILGRIAEAAVGWNRKLLEIKLPTRKAKEEGLPEAEAVVPETAEPALEGEEIPKKRWIKFPERLVIRGGHALCLFFALLLLSYAFTAQSRARIFRKDYYLWTNTSKTAPYDARAHVNLGKILMRKNVTRWAKMSFRKAVEADSTLGEAHHGFSTTLSMTGQEDSALVHARVAVRLDPDHVESFNNLGIIYGNKMDYDSAIAAFERVLELDSTHFSAANNLGIIYSDIEEFSQALKYLEMALEIAPSDDQAEAVRDKISQIRVRGYR